MEMWQTFKNNFKRKCISKCAVAGCKTKRRNQDPNVTLFAFPKDVELKKIWCQNLGISNYFQEVYNELRVCSLHFSPHFLTHKGNRFILASKNAVPINISEELTQKTFNSETFDETAPFASTHLSQSEDSFLELGEMEDIQEMELSTISDTTSSVSELSFGSKHEFSPIEPYFDESRPSTSHGFHYSNNREEYQRPSTSTGLCNSSSSEDIPAKKYFKLEARLLEKNMQIHNLKRQLKRKLEKITSISDILAKLRSERLVDEESETIIKCSAKEVPAALFRRYASNESLDKVTKNKYSNEIKTFAHTLHFYSPKAYNYVRDVFKCALPHPSTVRRWYSKVDGTPGFTEPAISAIRSKANLYKKDGQELCIALMMDEMSIMRKTELVGGRLLGQIDMGIDYPTECEKEAVEALVIMAVGMKEHWKIPIAYFLINGISASMKTEIVSIAIEKLSEAGAKVVSLTCDGLISNQNMLEKLGAVLSVKEPKPWFYFKENPLQKIYVLLDPCHMLKLIRNRLYAEKALYTVEGIVRWKYIDALYNLQTIEEFKLGNKLSKSHIEFQKKKMKVSLAAQTLSQSVATAIEFCDRNLKLPEFEGSEPTVKFIRRINVAFDLLNSRNPFGQGLKAPIRKSNKDRWLPEISLITKYLSVIKLNPDVSIFTTNKATGFLGLYLGLNMLESLYQDLIETNYLKYILTYKLSQDHLELFFCALRSRSGTNNNPTPRQFIAGYKQLLIHSQVKSFSGNVGEADNTEILGVVCNLPLSSKDGDVQYPIDMFDIEVNENLDGGNDVLVSEFLQQNQISPFQENVIGYISGYVVKMARKIIKCTECINAMYSEYGGAHPTALNLLFLKTRGGLIIPAKDVTDLCIISNQYFKSADINFKVKNQDERLALRILRDLNISELFPSLHNHQFDTEIDNNHIYKLAKVLIKCFIKIKFSQISRQINEANTTHIRQQLSRLIIFRNE